MNDLIKRLQYVLDNTHDHEAFALARDCKADTDPDDGTSWFHDVANHAIALCEESK